MESGRAAREMHCRRILALPHVLHPACRAGKGESFVFHIDGSYLFVALPRLVFAAAKGSTTPYGSNGGLVFEHCVQSTNAVCVAPRGRRYV